MATTSTVPTVKARLVTLLTTALASASEAGGQVQVSYAWSGAATESESVFLGRRPVDGDAFHQTIGGGSIATMKAGRKQRNEDYPVELTVWVFRPDLTPDEAATADARGFALLAKVEDVLANDPKLGLGTAVISAELSSFDHALFPYENGWACLIIPTITVRARLS